MPKRYYLQTLGCAKNTVDAQSIGRLLAAAGYAGTTDPSQAEVLIVNTCGFIEPARDESLAALREVAATKRSDQLLIAAGCLAQRVGADLAQFVPGVDGILGTQSWMGILHLLDRLQGPRHGALVMCQTASDTSDLLVRTQRVAVEGATAYLQIADGCSASCAFCAIPAIKGPARSRAQRDIVADARQLLDDGVQEIILIAQDTAAYGWDRGEREGLPRLIDDIVGQTSARGQQVRWLRLLYAYPQHISRRLIQVMAAHPQVCHYLDLPLQHAHPDVLRRMGRPADMGAVRQLIADLRSAMPDIALRTSFIVGFPGETPTEFQVLLEFMTEIQFDRVGVFTYSREEGTVAADLPGQLPEEVKASRYDQAMALQQTVSLTRNQGMLGCELEVLVEGCSDGLSMGRSYRDAPEIDGLVIVEEELPTGTFTRVRITQALEYDLVGTVVGSAPLR